MNDLADRHREFIVQTIPIRDDPVEHARKARRRTTPNKPRSSPACWSCRTRKVRCIQGAADGPCLRCKHFEHICVPQTRPKRPYPLKHMYRDFVSRMEFTPPASTTNTPESTSTPGEISPDSSYHPPFESVSTGTQTEYKFEGEQSLPDDHQSPRRCDETERPQPMARAQAKVLNLGDSLEQACMMLSKVEAMTRSLQGVISQLAERHGLVSDQTHEDKDDASEWMILEEGGWDHEGVASVLDVWDEIGELNIA